MSKQTPIYEKYQELLSLHGHPRKIWPQWCGVAKNERTRQIIALGAILTQRTSWTNAEQALMNLKEADLLSIKKVAETDLDRLTELVRVAGFYTTKPKRLQALCRFILDNYGTVSDMQKSDLGDLREELLEVYGIGPETADALLLYALDKPSFVIDAYANRFVEKYGLATTDDYHELKDVFESSLPTDVEIYQNYHVLIIVDQKGIDKSGMEVV